jgi:hypothetical protein
MQVVECLTRKYEVLSSNCSITYTHKNRYRQHLVKQLREQVSIVETMMLQNIRLTVLKETKLATLLRVGEAPLSLYPFVLLCSVPAPILSNQ